MTSDAFIATKLRQMASMMRDATIEARLKRLTYALKYSPDQPRVPAGSPGGGQWTSGGDGFSDGQSDSPEADRQLQLAAMSRIARCEAQWKSDIFHCNMVGLPTCYSQAMVRLIACEKGHPIPPLNY